MICTYCDMCGENINLRDFEFDALCADGVKVVFIPSTLDFKVAYPDVHLCEECYLEMISTLKRPMNKWGADRR